MIDEVPLEPVVSDKKHADQALKWELRNVGIEGMVKEREIRSKKRKEIAEKKADDFSQAKAREVGSIFSNRISVGGSRSYAAAWDRAFGGRNGN